MQITYGQNDWTVIGDGQWSWADGAITQTSIGEDIPQNLLFHSGSPELKRTVAGRLQITAVAENTSCDADAQPGLLIFEDVSLTVSTMGIEFWATRGDGDNWQVDFAPEIGMQIWLKVFYDPATGVFQGKYWLDGQSEPVDWQLSDLPWPNWLPGESPRSGVAGQTDYGGTTAAVDSFSITLASESASYNPWFKSGSILIGGGA